MFTSAQAISIQESINRAIGVVARKYQSAALRNEAADVASDAMIKVLSGYDPARACPEAYAYTVATRCALDFLRNLTRKHTARHVSMDAPATTREGSPTLADTLAAALDDAPTAMGAESRARAVAAAVAKLSDAQRDAIEAWLDDQTMTGGQRIAKMRAIEAIQESIAASL